MNRQQLETTLQQDADQLPLCDDAVLQQRIRQAVIAHAHTRKPSAIQRQPSGLRWLLALAAPAAAAVLLLVSLPTRTPQQTPPTDENTIAENHSSPSLRLMEQQLQRQLASNEQSLLQELQRIDQDWQHAKSVMLPVSIMK